MPNLWDKLPDTLPAAELNPLTNPLLERNLRRWANVYFGNPPAKRERAVSNLLEELKRESGNMPSESTPSSRMLDAKFLGVVCSACQHQNPTGHKFCSRCGGRLHPTAGCNRELYRSEFHRTQDHRTRDGAFHERCTVGEGTKIQQFE